MVLKEQRKGKKHPAIDPCHSSDFCINRQPLLVFWLISTIWFSFTVFRIHFGFRNHYWVVNVCESLFWERCSASRWCQGHCLAPPGGVRAVLHTATLLGAFRAECDENCAFHWTSRVLPQVYFNPFRSSRVAYFSFANKNSCSEWSYNLPNLKQSTHELISGRI